MSEQGSIVDESSEKFQPGFKATGGEFHAAEESLEEAGSEFRDQAESQFRRIQSELRKYSLVQRAETMRDDVAKEVEKQGKWLGEQVGSGVETLLGTLKIASRGEVEKLDKKLNRINRKLNALDKTLNKKVAVTSVPSNSETAVAK